MNCEAARDLLPLLARPEPVAADRAGLEAHLNGCDECRAQAELLAVLQRNPVAAPPELASRILDAHRSTVRSWRPAARHYALAATLAGALLAGALLRDAAEDGPVPGLGADAEVPVGLLQSFWPGDDGLAAGITPTLHDLSVDELELLLAELDS